MRRCSPLTRPRRPDYFFALLGGDEGCGLGGGGGGGVTPGLAGLPLSFCIVDFVALSLVTLAASIWSLLDGKTFTHNLMRGLFRFNVYFLIPWDACHVYPFSYRRDFLSQLSVPGPDIIVG